MAKNSVEVSWNHPDTEVDYIVECEISGRYCPGTWNDPPEYPEVDIVGVSLDEKNAPPLPKEEESALLDYINKHCYDEVADKALEMEND